MVTQHKSDMQTKNNWSCIVQELNITCFDMLLLGVQNFVGLSVQASVAQGYTTTCVVSCVVI